MPSPVKLPDPDTYGRKLAERRLKASGIPDILARLERLASDVSTYREASDTLLASVVNPYETVTADINDRISQIDDAQGRLFVEAVQAIRDAAVASDDAISSMTMELKRLQSMMAGLPAAMPKPEAVDLDGAVRSITVSLDAAAARLRESMEAMKPEPAGPIPTKVEVRERDKDGNIKKVDILYG